MITKEQAIETNLAQVYETAGQSWQPDLDDNPDNYWFYAAQWSRVLG